MQMHAHTIVIVMSIVTSTAMTINSQNGGKALPVQTQKKVP